MNIKPDQTINNQPDRKDVLRAVAKYHYLTVAQLQAVFGLAAYGQARYALFSLCKSGFLERLILTKAARLLTYIHVFALSRQGASQLSVSNRYRIFYLKPGDRRSTVFLEHTILINDFRICLECLENRLEDFQLVSWKQRKEDVKIKIN